MPSVVPTNPRYVDIANGTLPQGAERRRVVWLASLVAYDVALVGIGLAEGELLGGLAVSRCNEFGEERIRYWQYSAGVGGLGLVLVEGTASDIHSSRTNPKRSALEVNIDPALAGDLATPQPRKGEMPRMPITIVRDAAQHNLQLVGRFTPDWKCCVMRVDR
jgi:hypothetical protein